MDIKMHLWLMAFLSLALCSCTSLTPQKSVIDKEVVFQTSTINTLLAGVYDGEMTFSTLKTHGDFGIGTFQALDGEMAAVDGVFYQIKSDGKVYPVKDSMKTPFASVTYFDADTTFQIDQALTFPELTRRIDSILPTPNILYAVKIEGDFNYVKARSVPKQTKPYRPLVDVVKEQPTFEFNQVKGTFVGFRLPDYVAGINVPGYHFHFLNADKSRGGHVLAAEVQHVTVSIDYTSEIRLTLLKSPSFYGLDFSAPKEEELSKVEK